MLMRQLGPKKCWKISFTNEAVMSDRSKLILTLYDWGLSAYLSQIALDSLQIVKLLGPKVHAQNKIISLDYKMLMRQLGPKKRWKFSFTNEAVMNDGSKLILTLFDWSFTAYFSNPTLAPTTHMEGSLQLNFTLGQLVL